LSWDLRGIQQLAMAREQQGGGTPGSPPPFDIMSSAAGRSSAPDSDSLPASGGTLPRGAILTHLSSDELPLSGSRLLLAAARFAAEKHRAQRRKDAEASPYINHPIAVAATLADAGITDVDILAAALLHDTIEDTDTTAAELEEHFGSAIRALVEEMTDDKSLDKAVRKELQVEHAPHASAGARMIKLADKICNVRDVAASLPPDWPRARRLEYLDWSARVVAGCRGCQPALESAFDRDLVRAREQLAAEERGDRDSVLRPGGPS